MGILRESGYSATAELFFAPTDQERIPLAKTGSTRFVLAAPCELPPGTSGDLIVIVDGRPDSRRVVLPTGVAQGQTTVSYDVEAPF